MIHYYFGDGKGKTSAAAGACLRACGNGLRCIFVQFMKDGSSGEINALRQLDIPVLACFEGIRFYKQMTPDERLRAAQTHNQNLQTVLDGEYDLIVLDELGDALYRELADAALAERVLQKPDCELIVTGHRLVSLLTGCADYLTEFRCLAHPYQHGLAARRGIEY